MNKSYLNFLSSRPNIDDYVGREAELINDLYSFSNTQANIIMHQESEIERYKSDMKLHDEFDKLKQRMEADANRFELLHGAPLNNLRKQLTQCPWWNRSLRNKLKREIASHEELANITLKNMR